MAGSAVEVGREGEAAWTAPPPLVPNTSVSAAVRSAGKDKCFNCGQQGHWAKDCPAKTRTPGRSPAVSDHEVQPWECRCGEGTCNVVTISGSKQYCCPGRQEDGRHCGFRMPCDMAVFDKNDMPRRPICSCKAGLSRIYMMNGRAHFGCSVKKGEGACSFFQWCDEIEGNNGQSDGGAAPDVSIGPDKRGSINIPLIDGIEELGEREQIIHEAFKRKCDEVNQTGCASSEQKKMKIEVAAGSRPLIEPVQLTSLENAAHNVDFDQFTPVHNASTRSAEVSSHVMEACVNDVAESTSNVSSPKGPTRGGSAMFGSLIMAFSVCCMLLRNGVAAIMRFFDLAVPQAVDQDGKSKGSVNGSKVDFISRNGSSHIFPSTQRRLEFDEAEYTDSVTNKMLVVIDRCIRSGSGSSKKTRSPIVTAYSIITLSQSPLATDGKLLPEENKIHRHLFTSSSSSLLCILHLLKCTPLKDLPSLEDGIRHLISDISASAEEVKVLNSAVECLLHLSDAYQMKEVAPSFAPSEEEFQHSQAVTEAEISKMTDECSKTSAALKEASVQVEKCRANREKAEQDVKALEAELDEARMEAKEMCAREQEAREKFQKLEDASKQMVQQLGDLVICLASEDYEHQERIAAFDAEDKKRLNELTILEEAAKVIVRMLEGRL